jgi:energy-coupling factor transporter ATP-binding protein EcfA2
MNQGIRWHDRVFVVGYTGSGKSEVLNLLFSQLRNQKLLLDTKPEFTIPGVQPVSRVPDIDWSQPIIHYRDLANSLEDYDELFYEAHHRRNFTVCCHELADLCEDQPNRAPEWVRKSLRKGNVFGNGVLGGTQRPVGMPRQGRTEAQHVIYMVPQLDPDDHQIVAKMMQRTVPELDRLLGEASQLAPDPNEPVYSAVWFDRRAGQVTLVPPLPAHVRRRILVRRAVDLDSRGKVERDGPGEGQEGP